MNNRTAFPVRATLHLLILVALIVAVQHSVLQAQGINPTDPCADGSCARVKLYEGFDDDLRRMLSLQTNHLRPTDATARATAIQRMKTFAGSININADGVVALADGSQKLLVKDDQGVVLRYFQLLLSEDASRPGDEVLVARRGFIDRPGSKSPLSDSSLRSIADGARSRLGLPLTLAGDAVRFAGTLTLRKAADEDLGRYLQQTAGYWRELDGRQVINSALFVEIDPGTKQVNGVSQRNWWGVSAPQAVELKSFSEVKDDIIATLSVNSSRDFGVKVNNCIEVFYQLPDALVPAVTCNADPDDEGGGVTPSSETAVAAGSSAVMVTVSLANGFFLDEIDATLGSAAALESGALPSKPGNTNGERFDLYSASSDDLPTDVGDTDGARFGTYYSSDEDRFWKGADKFIDKFSSTWSNYVGPWLSYQEYFEGSMAYWFADAVDLLYITGHGTPRAISGEDGSIYLNHSSYTVAQLGVGDLEYLTFTGCHAGTPVYCDGMSAVNRYTDSSSRDSVFTGLHIFSSNHGVTIGSGTIHREKARRYANNLGDGQTLIEAWYNAEVDGNSWHRNDANGCYQIGNPSTGCSDFTKSDCSRWTAYPSSFYIDGKRRVAIDNRGDYTSDPRLGDSAYDIDLIYTYTSESVPMSSAGHSLP